MADTIKIGNLDISSFKVGSADTKVYLGDTLLYPTTPPTLSSNALDYTNNCPIYVPSASVNAYKSANNWSTYASRIQAIQ